MSSTPPVSTHSSFIARSRDWLGRYALYIIFIQLLAAIIGSMYFSNILLFAPCTLCWYQRIALFPIILTIIAGIIKNDRTVYHYIFPTAIIGWIIALFHNLLYYGIIPETLAPCTTGVSCTTKFVEYFGFITIPLLSFLAFTAIIILTNEYRLYQKRIQDQKVKTEEIIK